MKSWGMFINGEYRPAASSRTLPVCNPKNGEAFAQVAEGKQADIATAVDVRVEEKKHD